MHLKSMPTGSMPLSTGANGERDNPANLDSDEEYDPFFPTRYDLLLKDRESRVKKQALQAMSQIKADAALSKAGELLRKLRQDEPSPPSEAPSLTTLPPMVPITTTPSISHAPSGGSKMAGEAFLRQMGWNAGQGLGVMEQGMKNPLEARKVAPDTAIITQAPSLDAHDKAPSDPVLSSASALKYGCPRGLIFPDGSASRILCLGNIALRATVGKDANLEEEILEELSTFGNLNDIKIEVAPSNLLVQKHEEVRIFCEFEQPAEALAARQSLHGRMFNGRQIVPCYYDEILYKRKQYFLA